MIDTIAQVGIVAFGCPAIWLVGRLERWRRWGYILGLCSQPCWIFTALHNRQWGILLISFWFTYSWSQGVYNYWIKSSIEK